jgi:acyl dehydratase
MEPMNDVRTEQIQPTHSIAPMIMRHLPSMPALLGKAAFKSGSYQIGDPLPGLSAQVNGLMIDAQHLAAYKELCGFAPEGNLPATYLHMLAFPLFLQILTQQDFPIRAMGQVHLRNQISVLKSFDIKQPISMTAAVGGSELTSRGLEWDIRVIASIDDQTLWSSNSTFLHRCKTEIKQKRRSVNGREGESQQWRVSADIGRRYARVSGDYNPIHLADMTAKLFGFKQAIAHGMWSKARCLAALEEQLPETGYSVAVNFHRPLFLPSNVLFYTKQLASKKRFSLYNQSGDQAHLDGLIS